MQPIEGILDDLWELTERVFRCWGVMSARCSWYKTRKDPLIDVHACGGTERLMDRTRIFSSCVIEEDKHIYTDIIPGREKEMYALK